MPPCYPHRGRLARFASHVAPLLLVACGSSGQAPAVPTDGSVEGQTPDSAVADSTVSDAADDTSLPLPDASAGVRDAGSDAGNASAADANVDVAAPPPDSGADASAPPSDGGIDASVPLPALPLQTSSRWIVDANGKRFKLASVNWYGAEEKDFVVGGLDLQDVHAIARSIRVLGFNSVRLPFSNQLVESNPIVADARLAANPPLQGQTALQVLDAVIAAIAAEGLVVILDDHMSNADWCCSATDGNGLWYNVAYPESSWIADWRTMAARYASQPAVVGVDLRNELRPSDAGTPVWGGSDATVDWHGAAERGGNAVLGVNPNLLVIVEGLNYSNDLTGVYSLPIELSVANRLVYSPHDYEFDHPSGISAADLATDLGDEWAYILAQGNAYTAPVWVGEFGTCNSSSSCVVGPASTSDQGSWFAALEAYLTNADIDWSFWAINGTESSGTGRTLGAPESYGVLDPEWDAGASAALTSALQAIQPATQGP